VKRTARTEETLLVRMKAKGLRLTGQRKTLAELLETADEHLDAESVYQRAKLKDSTIHRATVYRTLNRLKKLGLVDELDLMHVSGERHFYEIRPSTLPHPSRLHGVQRCRGAQRDVLGRPQAPRPQRQRLPAGSRAHRDGRRVQGVPAQAFQKQRLTGRPP
jgi:Fe2+ or Zn2+ uptake regulation protein